MEEGISILCGVSSFLSGGVEFFRNFLYNEMIGNEKRK